MEAELAALATSGATALIGLMVSDSWTQMKEGFARLFAHGGAADGPLRELETSRIELLTAHLEDDHTKAAVIEADWRTRLGLLLGSDATAQDELRRLLDPLASRPAGPVYNVNSGDVQFGSIIQAGQISGTSVHITPTADEHIRRREGRQ
ncbi:hypothetical protein AB0L00_43280 [Actinoallomurus sp. NPDC052308]|uniref:hypothetical protein n=1 Tax=Actinoallomurus sp. NPDC052308 TaxID=3155530 RepID=UPI00344942A3